jgi:hypothetical protein
LGNSASTSGAALVAAGVHVTGAVHRRRARRSLHRGHCRRAPGSPFNSLQEEPMSCSHQDHIEADLKVDLDITAERSAASQFIELAGINNA